MKKFLATIIVIAFFALVGTVGSLDLDKISLTQGFVQVAISIGVMGISAHILHRLDD